MAPSTRGVKRGGSSAPTLAKKARARVDSQVSGVQEAVGQSELPEAARQMLIAALPHCLGIPANERHELQTQCIMIVKKALDGIQENIVRDLAAANEKVGAVEKKKEVMDKAIADAEQVLGAAVDAAEAKKVVLAEVTKSHLAAKGALADARQVQEKNDASLKLVANEKDVLEKAIGTHFQALKDGSETAGQHLDEFLPLVKDIGLDDSLMTALPSTVTKTPTDRGTFDKMVIDELEKALKAKCAALNAKLESGAPGAAERAAAVEDARKKLEHARADVGVAASDLTNAQEVSQRASTALEEAKSALAVFEPERKAATKERKVQQWRLDEFEVFTLEGFNEANNKNSKVDADDDVDASVVASAIVGA